MMHAIHAKDFVKAEAIRASFVPLEDLRNTIQPIRVLHEAVAAAGIAATGPMQPLLGELSDANKSAIKQAVEALLALPAA